MSRLDIYICTKSKCTAKRAQLKLSTEDVATGSYNGPELLDALRKLVARKELGEGVEIHEAACMSGCPVGPRVDMIVGSRRIMYFQRKTPTGREDLISWVSVGSVEEAIDTHLRGI